MAPANQAKMKVVMTPKIISGIGIEVLKIELMSTPCSRLLKKMIALSCGVAASVITHPM